MLCLSVLLSLVLLPTLANAAQLEIAFEDQAATLAGATPSGQVVWFSVATESAPYVTLTVPRHGLNAADTTGVARFELESSVPPSSIWIAVDLASGAFQVGAPPGFPLREAILPPGLLRADLNGRVNLLVGERPEIQFLLVRPGLGAWVGRASEGAPDDADQESNGILTASIQNLRPLEGSPGVPEELSSGDVLAVIDPATMEVAVLRVSH